MRLVDTFAASQVDKIQLGDLHLRAATWIARRNIDPKDRVTTTRGLIEARFSHVSHLIAPFHVVQHFRLVRYVLLGELVDVDALDALTHV